MKPEKPCPVYVLLDNGRRIYCEQPGGKGHPGTHAGDRSYEEYRKLLAAAEGRAA